MLIDWHCPAATWQNLLDRVPQATFFHTPAWAAGVEAAGGVRGTALHVRWPDGRQAVVPLAVRPIWGGWLQIASTALEGCYGGILADGPVSDAQQSALFLAMRRRFPDLRIYGNPFMAPPSPAIGLRPSEATQVRVFRLAPLETLRQGYRSSRRRDVRRYQTDGVGTTVLHRPDDRHLADFMRLYEHEIGHWASLEHAKDAAWFQRLWDQARTRLSLMTAHIGGESAGVALVARQGQVATQLVMAWDRRFAAHQVPTALMEACLEDAYAQGCQYLDVMSCAEQAGIEFFKASFGAEALPIWCDYRTSAVTAALTAAQAFLKGRISQS
ncbi:MAG: GNAT family N-acetyltransferase [Candidatus Sericytochromatia bacterium]|nr:GNAT family N-acetyltransferase [Candidatus Sericytochromatia bacterium]